VDVDWKVIQPYLTESFEGQIDYAQFLNRFVINVGSQVSAAFEKDVIQKMCVKLVENMGNLKEAFASFDVNGDGTLSYSEFVNVLKLFDLGLSEDQMLDFTASLDEDENGTIEFEEFENRFSVDFKLESTDEGLRKKLQDISKKLLQSLKEIKTAFASFDVNGDGQIDFDEFVKALTDLGFGYDPEVLKSLFHIIDKDQSGSITIDEFVNSFSVVDEKSDLYTQNIIQKVCLAIYKGRHKLKHLFREMDLDGNNKIDIDEFTVGLDALGLTLEKPLTKQQISVIFNSIDADGSGEIDFDEFTNAFKLVDSGSSK
jgi:Ca2+-binding EF-hand superfamily protein